MPERPLVVLVEWNAPDMSFADAQAVAKKSLSVLGSAAGLLDARFFGDFETGTHCFLLTWRDEKAMEQYMASEAMQSVRGSAAPFVVGPPTRRIFVDYGSGSNDAKGGG